MDPLDHKDSKGFYPNMDKLFGNDSIVEEVRQKFSDRAAVGYKKYNATMDRDDLSIDQWLEHAQEEAMDFILYITKVRKELSAKKFCECPQL